MEDLKKAAAELNQRTEALKSGEEPISGEQGAGTASEPFDQGNSEGLSYLVEREACKRDRGEMLISQSM